MLELRTTAGTWENLIQQSICIYAKL